MSAACINNSRRSNVPQNYILPHFFDFSVSFQVFYEWIGTSFLHLLNDTNLFNINSRRSHIPHNHTILPHFSELSSSAGLRVCGFAGLRVCGFAGLRVCGFAGLRVCGFAGLRVCGFAGLRVCGFAGLRVCGFAGLRVCGFAGLRVCGFAGLRVCGFAGLRVCGFAGLRVFQCTFLYWEACHKCHVLQGKNDQKSWFLAECHMSFGSPISEHDWKKIFFWASIPPNNTLSPKNSLLDEQLCI